MVRQEGKGLLVGFTRQGKDRGEWRFGMETEGLARDWVDRIRAAKQATVAEKLGVGTGVAEVVGDVVDYGLVGEGTGGRDRNS